MLLFKLTGGLISINPERGSLRLSRPPLIQAPEALFEGAKEAVVVFEEGVFWGLGAEEGAGKVIGLDIPQGEGLTTVNGLGRVSV